MKRRYDDKIYEEFPNAPKSASQRRREANDAKLVEEFGSLPRFKGLGWYSDKSEESRHRCLVFTCVCGREMKIMPHSIRKGYNKELLCPNCVTPVRRRGQGSVNPKYLTQPYHPVKES